MPVLPINFASVFGLFGSLRFHLLSKAMPILIPTLAQDLSPCLFVKKQPVPQRSTMIAFGMFQIKHSRLDDEFQF